MHAPTHAPTHTPTGLLGGTFDPPHNAHLRLAIEARESLGLATVRFIPAGAPPLRAAPCAASVHRLEMVRRAIVDEAGFSVDTRELDTDAPSYTIDTLERLRAESGLAQPLVLLVGADAFARFEAWHRWREIFDLAHVAVATRPRHTLKVDTPRVLPSGRAQHTALGQEVRARLGDPAALASTPAGRIVHFAITPLEISATAIRDRLARGLNVRHLVPDAVLDYIHAQQIYQASHGH
jgi:nicotinate-nucleotide adenylyltransferase